MPLLSLSSIPDAAAPSQDAEEMPRPEQPAGIWPQIHAPKRFGCQQADSGRNSLEPLAEQGVTLDKLEFPSILRPKFFMDPSHGGRRSDSPDTSPLHHTDGTEETSPQRANHFRSPPRPRPSAILKPARAAPIIDTAPSAASAKMRTRASKAKANSSEAAKSASQTVAADPATTATAGRRVTRSQSARTAAAVTSREPDTGLRPTSRGSRNKAAADSKPVSQPSEKGMRTALEAPNEPSLRAATRKVVPRARVRRKRDNIQGTLEGDTAAPEDRPEAAPNRSVVSGPESVPAKPNRVASRNGRPKAADFWEAPSGDAEGSTGAPLVAEPEAQSVSQDTMKEAARPPVTPRIPWNELYGIPDEPGNASMVGLGITNGTRAGGRLESVQGETNGRERTRPSREKRNASRRPPYSPGTSRQHVRGFTFGDPGVIAAPFPSDRNALPLSTPNAGGRRRDRSRAASSAAWLVQPEVVDHEHQADPHDAIMAADYIPLSPGPLPRVPKIARRRAKKRRPKISALEEEDSGAAGTPPPSPAGPLRQPRQSSPPRKLPRKPERVPEADPTIWDLASGVWGRQATRPPRRDWPPRQGSVYCETCFRDDCARWIRIRDGVLRALRLLGGDSALQAIRRLAERAVEAESEMVYRHMMRGRPDRPKTRLGSPPPPERSTSSGSEDEDSDADDRSGKASVKKFVILPDAETRAALRLFNGNSDDVVGLVLLQIFAETRMPILSQIDRNEVSRILETLPQEMGLSGKELDTLEAQCRGLLESSRSPTQLGVDWWEFDETLQNAHRKLSKQRQGRHLPSAFATLLAKKAHVVAVAAAATAAQRDHLEDNTVPGQAGTQDEAEELAQLEQELGLGMPSSAFLKSIGDKIAEARWAVESKVNEAEGDTASPQTTPTWRKRSHDDASVNAEDEPTSEALNAHAIKRRRTAHPNQNVRNGENARDPDQQSIDPRTLSLSRATGTATGTSRTAAISLPCQYCAESDAVHRSRATQRAHYPRNRNRNRGTAIATGTGTGTGVTDTNPWVKPLMWAFHFDVDAATRVLAEDFLHLVATSRGAASVEVADGTIRFLVDTTGGETRIVLVEMRSVFDEALWAAAASRRRRRRRVRFRMPIGVWEKWKDGELQGYKIV
ncbi:hypothetical protein VTK56DRAFT_1506 [Thermocarpiscus australiensis]